MFPCSTTELHVAAAGAEVGAMAQRRHCGSVGIDTADRKAIVRHSTFEELYLRYAWKNESVLYSIMEVKS